MSLLLNFMQLLGQSCITYAGKCVAPLDPYWGWFQLSLQSLYRLIIIRVHNLLYLSHSVFAPWHKPCSNNPWSSMNVWCLSNTQGRDISCSPLTAWSIYSISITNFPSFWQYFMLPVTHKAIPLFKIFCALCSLLASISLMSTEWFWCMYGECILRHAQEGSDIPAKMPLYLLLFWNFLKLL
jgi:hypothetical protein